MNLEEQNVMENAARDEALLQVYPILRWFEYRHLPVPLQHISALFHELAWGQARAAWVPFNPNNPSGSDSFVKVEGAPATSSSKALGNRASSRRSSCWSTAAAAEQ